MNDNELMHWGVLGMKWGVRRYQNRDGTLTNAGKKRKKQAVDSSYQKAHSKKKLKYMSDNELKEVNKRLNAEKQYRDLTRKKSRGKSVVTALISTAGTIAAAETAYQTYKKLGDKAIDKLGDMVMKDLAKGLTKRL